MDDDETWKKLLRGEEVDLTPEEFEALLSRRIQRACDRWASPSWRDDEE